MEESNQSTMSSTAASFHLPAPCWPQQPWVMSISWPTALSFTKRKWRSNCQGTPAAGGQVIAPVCWVRRTEAATEVRKWAFLYSPELMSRQEIEMDSGIKINNCKWIKMGATLPEALHPDDVMVPKCPSEMQITYNVIKRAFSRVCRACIV